VVSRPDIAYNVSQLASVQANPGQTHWKLAKHVLKYLAKTPRFGPTYKYSPNEDEVNAKLTYYVDASHADVQPHDFGPEDDGRRSYYGYVGMLAQGPITWCSRMHKGRRTLSSTESELVASHFAAKDILHIRWVLEDMGVDMREPTDLYEDNQACILICLKEGRTDRTKHIESKYFFVRDCVLDGTLIMKKVHTAEQTADVTTKALPKDSHSKHSKTLVGQVNSAYADSTPIHIPMCSALRHAKPKSWATHVHRHQVLLSVQE